MAISRGVNFNDTRIISTGKSKEEAVLQLINSLVTSADGTLQKKGYKFLSQAVGFMPGDFLTEALGLLDLKTPVQVYSKGYRLQLLRTIWQRLGYDAESADVEDVLGFLKTYLPEVIMGLRSANSRLRRQTASFYEAILVKMEQLGVLENFVEMVCAGLAANSVQTKTDTVHALELALAKLPKNGLFLQ
jgi:ribosomal RNA-processing protein 12